MVWNLEEREKWFFSDHKNIDIDPEIDTYDERKKADMVVTVRRFKMVRIDGQEKVWWSCGYDHGYGGGGFAGDEDDYNKFIDPNELLKKAIDHNKRKCREERTIKTILVIDNSVSKRYVLKVPAVLPTGLGRWMG